MAMVLKVCGIIICVSVTLFSVACLIYIIKNITMYR